MPVPVLVASLKFLGLDGTVLLSPLLSLIALCCAATMRGLVPHSASAVSVLSSSPYDFDCQVSSLHSGPNTEQKELNNSCLEAFAKEAYDLLEQEIGQLPQGTKVSGCLQGVLMWQKLVLAFGFQ